MPDIKIDNDPDLNLEPEPLHIKQPSEGGFFSFRKMISGIFIKIFYVIGAIVLTITGIAFIAKGAQNYDTGGLILLLYGTGILLLGNLVWRILCESWIVLFNIHDALNDISYELRMKKYRTY